MSLRQGLDFRCGARDVGHSCCLGIGSGWQHDRVFCTGEARQEAGPSYLSTAGFDAGDVWPTKHSAANASKN